MTSSPSTSTTTAQLLSITISLLSSGSLLSTSLFDTVELQSQPASRSLPQLRWYFSRGSHIFPQAAFVSSACFTYLAYTALPTSQRAITQLLHIGTNSSQTNAYLAAAALTMSIAPWTMIVMLPTNLRIIKINEELGGARSENAAKELEKNGYVPGERSAMDSVNGKGEGTQFELSGPQGETSKKSSREQDEEARELVKRFGSLNLMRALVMGLGGGLGLWAAVAGA